MLLVIIIIRKDKEMKKITIILFILLFLPINICLSVEPDSIAIVDISKTSSDATHTSPTYQTKNYNVLRGILTATGNVAPRTMPSLVVYWSNDGTDFSTINPSTIQGYPKSGAVFETENAAFMDINEPIRGKFVRIISSRGSYASYKLIVWLSKENTISRNRVGDTYCVLVNNAGVSGGWDLIVGEDPYRKYLQITNVGSGTQAVDAYIGFNPNLGTQAVNGNNLGIRLVPVGSATGGLVSTWTSDFSAGIYCGRIYAALGSSTGSTLLQYAEHH